MSNIFSTTSIVCFILAGISFLGAVVLFFLMNTKAAYLELKGKPQSEKIIENRKNEGEIILETSTRKIDIEDDAVTTILYPRRERRIKDV